MWFSLPASQGSGIPIGAIIAWTLETPPQYDGGIWLECNGQVVDNFKYRKLASMMSHVPDYRGVFLRGLGNITTPDSYYGSVNHSSDSLSMVQGDSSRELDGDVGYLIYGSATHGGDGGGVGFHPPGSQLMSKNQPFWHPDHSLASQIYSYAIPQSNYSDYEYYSTSYSNFWYNALTKYEYTLEGDKDIGYSLSKKEIHPALLFGNSSGAVYFDVSRVWPVSHEFRPVNKAVKYFIKAK